MAPSLLPALKITHWDHDAITSEVLEQCSKLFSTHYAIWGPKGVRPGFNVRASIKKLWEVYLFNAETCSLVTAESASGELLGHAFLCIFPFQTGIVAYQSGNFIGTTN